MERVFVYGSLRQGYWNHRRILADKAEIFSTARTEGLLYHLPEGYPAVIPGEGIVLGEVMLLHDPELLQALDRLEGYCGPGESNMYNRVEKTVWCADDTEISCWIYLYADPHYAAKVGTLLTDGDWTKFMENGVNQK